MIFEILRSEKFYGESEAIEIAKGKYELTTSFKKQWEQHKRKREWDKAQKKK